ncbi:hypothetical protein J8273_7047 [Carpediemonas membranifera]|uniref:Uncharacterized protein n=1 Tax=Carpediemonas membranifera TaxID=201153 RepID=A0A8J6B1A0_9EUKA|nr:hypothetical protein J8273_7047 [Carpediemonas membranifera]|eukprot:KAG9390794.1 hypothetical protein J8273_7047 [Carpediemonas membranifera]
MTDSYRQAMLRLQTSHREAALYPSISSLFSGDKTVHNAPQYHPALPQGFRSLDGHQTLATRMSINVIKGLATSKDTIQGTQQYAKEYLENKGLTAAALNKIAGEHKVAAFVVIFWLVTIVKFVLEKIRLFFRLTWWFVRGPLRLALKLLGVAAKVGWLGFTLVLVAVAVCWVKYFIDKKRRRILSKPETDNVASIDPLGNIPFGAAVKRLHMLFDRPDADYAVLFGDITRPADDNDEEEEEVQQDETSKSAKPEAADSEAADLPDPADSTESEIQIPSNFVTWALHMSRFILTSVVDVEFQILALSVRVVFITVYLKSYLMIHRPAVILGALVGLAALRWVEWLRPMAWLLLRTSFTLGHVVGFGVLGWTGFVLIRWHVVKWFM